MRVKHRLVGYDRHTDRIKVQFEVPDHLMPEAKKIARVPADDPDTVWSYPLSDAKARRLAHLIGAKAELEDTEFFLEAFAAISQQDAKP
jgi:hypothetical protein